MKLLTTLNIAMDALENEEITIGEYSKILDTIKNDAKKLDCDKVKFNMQQMIDATNLGLSS